jgi:hypothetical protein
MIDEKTIWDEVWPVVENLIEATLAEDAATMRTLLTPNGQAAAMLDLFDVYVYDILLKTVLGREQFHPHRICLARTRLRPKQLHRQRRGHRIAHLR